MRSSICSRRGPSHLRNADLALASDVLGAYLVADGEGDGAAGEAAAAAAVRAAERVVAAWRGARDAGAVEAAIRTVETANAELWRLATAQSAYPTMSASAALLLADGRHGVFLSVGSTALFRLRRGTLVRIDATPWLVGRRLGEAPDIELEPVVLDFQPGDTYLIATDGLHPALIRPEDLRAGMAQSEPVLVAEYLVAVAQDRGGVDDATALALKLGHAG